MTHVAGAKNRTGAAKGSLSGSAIAGDGVELGGFASWSLRIGSTSPWLGTDGTELCQQSLRSTLHSLSSGSGKLTAHRLQQAVKVNVGVRKVDVGEDAR